MQPKLSPRWRFVRLILLCTKSQLERQFKRQVNRIAKTAQQDSPDIAISRIRNEFRLLFANMLAQLWASYSAAIRTAQEERDRGQEIEKGMRDGSPAGSPMLETFAFPRMRLQRFAFIALLLLSIILVVCEGASFGWMQRTVADSYLFGLLWSLPVFVFAIIEAVVLHNRFVSERTRFRVVFIQAVIGLASAGAYIYLSVICSDTSLASLFLDGPQRQSVEGWRMLFQILTSLLFSGICVCGCFWLGERRFVPNREHAKALQQIRTHLSNADDHEQRAAVFIGQIREVEALQDLAIDFWWQMHRALKESEAKHALEIQEILDQEL